MTKLTRRGFFGAAAGAAAGQMIAPAVVAGGLSDNLLDYSPIPKRWMLNWLSWQMKRLGERIFIHGEPGLTAEYEKICHAYESLESGRATFTTTRQTP